MFRYVVLAGCLFGLLGCASAPELVAVEAKKFEWPNGAKVAVALTYDDALDSHLDIALPQLEAHDFKATFYLIISRPIIERRFDDWRALAEKDMSWEITQCITHVADHCLIANGLNQRSIWTITQWIRCLLKWMKPIRR